MAAPGPEQVFAVAVAGAAAVAGLVFYQLQEINRSMAASRPPFVDFEQLTAHLESKADKKDTVNVQGTVVQEENKCVKSGKGEVEGAARRVTTDGFFQRGDLCTNLSVSFLLRDPEGNTIRVLNVHTAKWLDSVMQLVSSERGYCEKVLTFGTRVWIRGCARIEADMILMNPEEIREEIL